ncbi:MAG: hypothetical protein K1000chlam2_01523 [Chlamydiae bacterium]|nr:hypothetical protein [Chlamydiota bacterium]
MLGNIVVKDSFFWFCALSGTGLFIILFISFLVGAGNDGDADDHDGEFRWLSKQAFTGFLMMFGWVGLTCRNQFGLGGIGTSIFSLAAGFVSMFVTGLIFKGALKLKSTGTVFRIEDAIGKQATVYQEISPNGIGKISVILNDLTHEIDAVTSHPEVLQSFTEVQIINQADDKTVVVVPITNT